MYIKSLQLLQPEHDEGRPQGPGCASLRNLAPKSVLVRAADSTQPRWEAPHCASWRCGRTTNNGAVGRDAVPGRAFVACR